MARRLNRSRDRCSATSRRASATEKPQRKHAFGLSPANAVAPARRSIVSGFSKALKANGNFSGTEPAMQGRLSHPLLQRGTTVLQKDGFFRRRDEGLFRQNQPTTAPTPAPAANAAPASPSYAETKVDERKEAKLVVGPDIKM